MHEVDLLLGYVNHFGGKHIQRLWDEHFRMFQHMKQDFCQNMWPIECNCGQRLL
jgi:hypothetical protein